MPNSWWLHGLGMFSEAYVLLGVGNVRGEGGGGGGGDVVESYSTVVAVEGINFAVPSPARHSHCGTSTHAFVI